MEEKESSAKEKMVLLLIEGGREEDVTVHFEGTPEEVESQIIAYASYFHPAGYNTHLIHNEVVDGVRKATVTRWRSCD